MRDDHPHNLHSEDNPLLLHLDPDDPRPAQGQQAVVGTDPWLEDFSRSPYDPLYGAHAAGRLTGQVMAHPPRRGWMRVVGWLITVPFLAGTLLRLVEIIF